MKFSVCKARRGQEEMKHKQIICCQKQLKTKLPKWDENNIKIEQLTWENHSSH